VENNKINSLLSSIVFVEVPESFIKHFSHIAPSIPLKKDVLLPVQLPDGVKEPSLFNVKTITEEMILSGMLVLFAYNRDHKHIDYYRKLFLLIRPNIKEEMLNSISIKINNEDYEMAENLLHSLIGLDSSDKNANLTLAYLYEKKAKRDERYKDMALSIYNQLILEEPPLPAVFFNAAIFFMEIKDYKRTKDLLETYIALKIDDEDADEVRKLEKAQNVLNYINNQIILDNNFKKAHAFVKNDKIDEAMPLIYNFIEENPKKWNGWFLLGWALRKAKRWSDSVSALEKCLELYKISTAHNSSILGNEYSQICNELSISLIENNKIGKARALLEEALSKDCENVKLISNLGIIFIKQGDKEKANAYFRTALYLDPNDEIAKAMLENL